MASSVPDAKIEPARPILPESSSDRVPSRETLVTTAMSALFLALGESKTLVRGLEAWQHDLDRSALKLAPLPSAVLLAASRLPRSPPSIRDAWAFFLRTVFSDKDCAKYCSLTLTPTLTFDMVVDVPALVVDVPRIVSHRRCARPGCHRATTRPTTSAYSPGPRTPHRRGPGGSAP